MKLISLQDQVYNSSVKKFFFNCLNDKILKTIVTCYAFLLFLGIAKTGTHLKLPRRYHNQNDCMQYHDIHSMFSTKSDIKVFKSSIF